MPEPASSTASHRHSFPWLVAAAVVLVSAAGIVLLSSPAKPVHLTVDGRQVAVGSGSDVGDLAADGLFKNRPGNLLSVKGSVIATAGGEAAVVLRNGRPAAADQRVYEGDVIVTRSGRDVFEPTVVVKREVAPSTIDSGTGPVLKLVSAGVAGLEEVRKGKVSGTVLSVRTLKPMQPELVERTAPSPTDKLVALTFDDGPWPGQTEKVLDVLKQHGVHATFFMLGTQVRRHPELARRVKDEGNLVANHSLSHKQLAKQKPAVIRKEIALGADTIQRATGQRPTWFRPPYGALNSRVWQQARKLGDVRIVLWSIDTRDWTKPGAARIVRNAEGPAKAGSIILMHDGGANRQQTIEALPRIIEDLQAQGFVFVTLDELAAAR